MSPIAGRCVIASKKKNEIVTIVDGAIRTPFSNEAFVKVETISINRGELRRAQVSSDGFSRIGWDFAGIIETPAADGSGPVKGTRVVGFSTKMEAWAEYVSISTDYIAPIPDNVTNAQASTLPVAGLTAIHSIDIASGILGRNALITGATGGVGIFAIQLAALSGATTFAQIRKPEQKAFIEQFGDFQIITSESGEGLTNTADFHLIADGLSGPILKKAIPSLAPNGICVCYGVTTSPQIPIDIGQFMRIGLARIVGFHLYSKSISSAPTINLPRLLMLVAEGRLNCGIEREASWSEINHMAIDLIDRKYFGKAVLHID